MNEQLANSLPNHIKVMRFLVAEKNPSLQRRIVSSLEKAGVDTIKAVAAGEEAWKLWEENRAFDIIICAAKLQGMAGLEFLGKLRADDESGMHPAFLMLSADNSKMALIEAQAKGADGFLLKPFSQDQLIPKLIEAVAARAKSGHRRTRTGNSLEDELLFSRLPVELLFDRYNAEAECEVLNESKAVIRVNNNYGLGTQLNMRFSRTSDGTGGFYKPIKGVVMKTERVPKEIGVFRMHVQFSGPVTPAHGVTELANYVPASVDSD